MTDKQPNALALADALETFHNPHDKQAAAELRRLHNEVRVLTECYRLDGARDIALLRQALEALEAALSDDQPYILQSKEAVSALRAALAEQPAEQEPVAWCDQYESHIDGLRHYSDGSAREIPLYAVPQPRRRLTDEEIDVITHAQWGTWMPGVMVAAHREYARAVEAEVIRRMGAQR